ncbi:MAG: trimethylamine methyltransferase, partial [Rhodospirillaceae bacterium]|nr:trimethylamine methyltransferase [Rhodospirillaceae bacterium]
MTERTARRGRTARRESRAANTVTSAPYITRTFPATEILGEEGLSLIEGNADTLLQEIGVEFRDDEEVLELWRGAGADVREQRVHFPKGLLRQLISTAPPQFIQHARNPARNVVIGGNNTVFAPVYGPPFVRDVEGGRR